MIRLRQIDAETLAAPRRGEPPVVPDGYERTNDPFIFKIKMPPCPHREERLHKRSCCDKLIIWCTKLNIPVSRKGCTDKLCERK